MKTDNELIAEFMGFYITSDRIGVDGNPDRSWKSNDHPYFGGFRTVHLQRFERDWSWLMPVVEKIESLHSRTAILFSSNHNHICTISDRSHTILAQKDGESKIESVYKAVVEFIKWYNSILK